MFVPIQQSNLLR